MNKNHLRSISAIVIIAVLITLFTVLKPFAYFQYGILVDEYKELLVDRPNYFNANENTNKYSAQSPITLPDSDIKVEIHHLGKNRPVRLRSAYLVVDEKVLFTSISAFTDKIESVKITNGDLESLAHNVYYYDEEWKSINTGNGFDLEETHESEDAFVYVSRYNRPNKFNEMKQTISFEYINDSGELVIETYVFNLHWYQYSNLFQQILFAS